MACRGDGRHGLAALLSLVGVKDLPPLQARMTFTMARQVVVEMARSFRVSPSRYEGGDRLPEQAFAQMEIAFAELRPGLGGRRRREACVACFTGDL